MVQTNVIRILSVEDHPIVREGLSTVIGSQADMLLVAQAINASEAIAQFRQHRPDITLMDLGLPGTDGTDALIASSVNAGTEVKLTVPGAIVYSDVRATAVKRLKKALRRFFQSSGTDGI